MRTPLNLVYATDARGVLGLAASAWSVLKHLPADRPVNVWILEQDLSWRQRLSVSETVRAARQKVAVAFVPIPESWFSGLLRSKSVPRAAYARLAIGEVLPEWVSRCLYLDIDTVCTTSVEPLFEVDLSGFIVAAVTNSNDASEGAAQFARLGIEETRYFNSGVLVCDLKAWRQARLGARTLEFARAAGSKLVLWDQDALNAELSGEWLQLPGHWNRWASSGEPLDGCIIHYTLTPKPWHPDYIGPGKQLFWSSVDETAFKGVRPWNPLGVGTAVRKVRAKIPYAPTVARLMREAARRVFRDR